MSEITFTLYDQLLKVERRTRPLRTRKASDGSIEVVETEDLGTWLILSCGISICIAPHTEPPWPEGTELELQIRARAAPPPEGDEQL